MIQAEVKEKILASVSEESIVEMSKDVISISSPTGQEMEMARYMRSTFEAMGLSVNWQEVEEGRANVVGIWEGAENGKSLMFNGHMDTSYTGQETHLTGVGYKPFPVVKDGVIYGLGIYNMKGALVCYTHAVKALQAAGVRVKGDVLIAAVAGEIEKSQWSDEFLGSQYRGYGTGTHHLVNHGICPDMCILGEPTEMQIVLGHFGSMWVRISTHGPFMHTAFSRDKQCDNAIRRMRLVLDDILEWIPSWEERAVYGGKKAIVNVGCIRGGHPWRASRLPDRCDVHLDLRVPPNLPMTEARRAVKDLLLTLREKYPDFGIEHEIYVTVPGAEIEESHPLIRAIDRGHQLVVGSLPARDHVLWSSDASVMTRYGIASVNYGPSSGLRGADGEKLAIETLVNMSRIYALIIADLCEVAG